jgi:hypothetical protein
MVSRLGLRGAGMQKRACSRAGFTETDNLIIADGVNGFLKWNLSTD